MNKLGIIMVSPFRIVLGRFFLFLLLAAALTTAAHAKTVNSSFGFTMTVPEGWLVLTKQELNENSELLLNALDGLGVDESISKQIKLRLKSGQLEFIYLDNSSSINIANNISVLKFIGRVPNQQQLPKTCDQYRAELPKVLNKPITVYECELREVAGKTFFYTKSDGVVDGSLSGQYQAQTTENQIVALTLVASESDFVESTLLFSNAMKTIDFK